MVKKRIIACIIAGNLIFMAMLLGSIMIGWHPSQSPNPLTQSRLSTSEVSMTEVTLISDGYEGVYWNDKASYHPAMVIDAAGTLHVVWDDSTDGAWGTDTEIMYVSHTEAAGWSNVTIISDGYGGIWWNNESSVTPAIAIDGVGVLHVVWQDSTPGAWGSDIEIMYANYTLAVGWSNATVISDNDTGWNTGNSWEPDIAIDGNGAIHVVWEDETSGAWGSDSEIMYTSYSSGVGWTNPRIISDWLGGPYWNTGFSNGPAIVASNDGVVHIVWSDNTTGAWGGNMETEIMYANYTPAYGWSNATVISDGYNGSYWNNAGSVDPVITISNSGIVWAVWEDFTDGWWGGDPEVMYATYSPVTGWSNVTILSDNASNWNIGISSNPEICTDDTGTIHVVWSDTSFPNYDRDILYRKYSTSHGWSAVTLVSDNASNWNIGESGKPAMAIGGDGAVHIVWEDNTPWLGGGDFEIYYYGFTTIQPGEDSIPGFNFVFIWLPLVLYGLIAYYKKHKRLI